MNKNALIVDDSRLACKIMANMLESLNIQTIAVYSAEDALEYLKQNLPDIIFLDHTMPGMDGLEMIKLIKSNPLTATVPVLMYTAKQGDVYVSQARALGAVDVLPKGMEKNYLVKALSKLGFIESIVDDEVDKSEEAEEIIQLHEQTESTSNTTIDEEVPWQTFWHKETEPFLLNQSKRHSNDIKYSIRQQTLKLTREIHQTLEHFEHALLSHMEVSDVIQSTNDEIKKQKIRKTTIIFGTLIIILQLGIFWQLYQRNQQNEQLLALYSNQHNLITQLNVQLSEREQQSLITKQPVTDTEVKKSDTSVQSVTLLDNFGGIVANNLYLSDVEKDEYIGTTSSGYQFMVNTDGKAGWPIGIRYFLSNDCSGEGYVESEKALVYRNNNGEIWYVDKMALVTEVPVGSMLDTAGKCLPGTGEVMDLRQLEKDYQFETGIDGTLDFILSFGK